MLKRVLMLAIATVFALSASAQDLGGWALGQRLGIYTN